MFELVLHALQKGQFGEAIIVKSTDCEDEEEARVSAPALQAG